MNQKKWIGIMLCIAVASGWSWGTKSNDFVTREIAVKEAFDKIHITGDFDVLLVPQEKDTVQLSGPERVIEKGIVGISNGILKTSYTRSGWNKKMPRLRLKIGVSSVNEIQLEGRAKIKMQHFALGSHLSVYVNGHSELKAHHLNVHTLQVLAIDEAEVEVDQLQAQIVHATQTEQAEIELSGLAHEAILENKGAGNLDAEDLRVHSAVVRLSGKGNIKVSAYESLSAIAQGKGAIFYKGSPIEIHREGNAKQIIPDVDD